MSDPITTPLITTPLITTTNKSNRDVNKQFDQKQFNASFESNDAVLNSNQKVNNALNINNDDLNSILLPHQKPVEDIIINIREMFYKILELLIDKQNPIEYIFSSPHTQFSFAILTIILGALLLLTSSLMISPEI